MSLGIDLWLWHLDQPPETVQALAKPLSDPERHRADRFVKAIDGHRFTVARGHLREILADYTGRPAARLDFDYGDRGKPYLRGGPAFNLSHSAAWAALVVAPDHPDLQIGVDIEAVRKIDPAVATRSFSALEQAEMRRLLPADWLRGFFNGWTRKEAVIKATGVGLGVDLKSFDVTLLPDQPARVVDSRGPLPPAGDWTMVNLDTGPGFCGAIAAVTQGGPLGPIVLREGCLPLFGTPLPGLAPVGTHKIMT